MNRYLISLVVVFFITSAVAQKKKKVAEPPKVETVEPWKGDEEHPTNYETQIYPPIVSSERLTQMYGTTTKGKEIKFAEEKEFDTFDFSTLKELHFTTYISDKLFDNALLEKLLNNATALETLTIENFKITAFPAIKGTNSSLKNLDLNRNNLKVLPPSFSNLVALKNFSSTNPLEEIPASFSQLKNLSELHLNNTDLSEFPAVVFDLHQLTVLYISGFSKGMNTIKEVPDGFDQLPQLKKLGVSSASLSKLPLSISRLKKLTNVDFSRNQFKEFPTALALNKSLVFVAFTNNPLDWETFKTSIKKIQWRGLFFLNETGFSKKQYQELQEILSKIDVYYDGMND